MLNVQSHRTQLVLTAVTASLATAGLFSAYQAYTRLRRRQKLNDEVQRSIAQQDGRKAETNDGHLMKQPSVTKNKLQDISGDYGEALVREQLARNYAIFGEDGMAALRKARVVVVGCGGVGSWAAVMLVRSGIANIRLIDFDYVTLSSLNRHATAMLSDVGTPKVKCVERTLKEISRWVEVDARVDMWDKKDGPRLLEGADWVIDAIDNLETKGDLLKYCHSNNIKIFASMGAGGKFDPTRVCISDISNTTYDPLASKVRQRLRGMGVATGIPVVFSDERNTVGLLDIAEEEIEKGNPGELGVQPGFRVRILPVLGPLPAIFGLHAATYILCELAGKPLENPLPVKGRRKLHEKMLRELKGREEKLTKTQINRLPIDEDDISFIFEDLHRGRSLIPPNNIPNKPNVTRWNSHQPLSLENCIVLDSAELERHMDESAAGKDPSEIWGQEVARVVERRKAEISSWRETMRGAIAETSRGGCSIFMNWCRQQWIRVLLLLSTTVNKH